MRIAFPVLQVSGDSITGFRNEQSFRQAVALTTDRAIKAGFFEKARLIDANLLDHRVQRLELAGRSGFFAWMQRGREIKALELTPLGETTLGEVKALVTSTIRSSAFWAENEDMEAVVSEVEKAETFSSLAALFG